MIAGAMKGDTLATTAGECLRDALSSIAEIIMKHSSPLAPLVLVPTALAAGDFFCAHVVNNTD